MFTNTGGKCFCLRHWLTTWRPWRTIVNGRIWRMLTNHRRIALRFFDWTFPSSNHTSNRPQGFRNIDRCSDDFRWRLIWYYHAPYNILHTHLTIFIHEGSEERVKTDFSGVFFVFQSVRMSGTRAFILLSFLAYCSAFNIDVKTTNVILFNDGSSKAANGSLFGFSISLNNGKNFGATGLEPLWVTL